MPSADRMLKKGARAVLAFAAVLCLAAAPALAAAKSEPDPLKNPVLAKLGAAGAKFYYLGTRSNLDGWLVIKDKQVQMLYSATDNKSVLIGALFDTDGKNLTVEQIKTLIGENKEVADFFKTAALSAAGAPASMTGKSPMISAAAAPAEAKPALSPGEQLLRALKGTSGVNLGSSAAPQLLMVMDTNCPHCRATWKSLRDFVFKGALQVRLIPIGDPDSEDERTGAQLLRSPGPLEAWDKYALGDKSQLAGAAEPSQTAAMRANHELIDRWHITATPYIVYRAKDGQVKIVQGEIQNIIAVMSDIGS